jgi:hypothetical protein
MGVNDTSDPLNFFIEALKYRSQPFLQLCISILTHTNPDQLWSYLMVEECKVRHLDKN